MRTKPGKTNSIRKASTRVAAPISVQDQQDLESISRRLKDLDGRKELASLAITAKRGKESRFPIPTRVIQIMSQASAMMAVGMDVAVVPIGKALTTQEAADLLNVSRQYVVRLANHGEIPSTRTGTHRRLKVEDVLQYMRVRDQRRMAKLDELTQASEDWTDYLGQTE